MPDIHTTPSLPVDISFGVAATIETSPQAACMAAMLTRYRRRLASEPVIGLIKHWLALPASRTANIDRPAPNPIGLASILNVSKYDSAEALPEQARHGLAECRTPDLNLSCKMNFD